MRDLITTVLELAGLLVLDVAAAVFLSRFDLALGLGGAGVLLLGESLLITASTPKVRDE